MDDPIIINDNKAVYHSQSFSSSQKQQSYTTLDEPVIQTIKRDIMTIFQKIKMTISGTGDYERLRKQWDLWGPLLISMLTACFVTINTNSGQTQQVFTTLFLGLWIGPLVLTLNSRLLGAKIPIIQTLCLIIYCSSPILMLAFVVFILNMFFHWFLLNSIIAGGAIVFTLKCNYSFFANLVPGQRRWLNLYPIMLFYAFIGLYIAMA